MQQKHKTELQEAHVRAQQEIYMAKNGMERPKTNSALTSLYNSTVSSSAHARPKAKVYFK